MAHLLRTANAMAADRMENEGLPLPQVSHMVRYHPRAGEIRRGRDVVPGIVLAVDATNRHLELLVFMEATDFICQERVPEWNGHDRGWERMGAGESLPGGDADINALKRVFFGWSGADQFDMPSGMSVMKMLEQIDIRLDKLEQATGAPPKAKRRLR